MNGFLVALSFLTRIPTGTSTAAPGEQLLRRSLMWFPVVGAILGFVTATVFLAARGGFPGLIAAGLALLVELRLSGAMHEDALGDSSDAFGGGWTSEDVLRIMKDSRLGTYGMTALVFGIGLRWMGIAHLPEGLVFWGIIGAAAFARLLVVVHLHLVPAARRPGGTADIWPARSDLPVTQAGILCLPCGLPILVLAPLQTLVGLALCWLAHVTWANYVQRRIGGRTGDTVGALAFAAQLILTLCFVFQL